MKAKHIFRQGFTLVDIAIVLVITGLIAGIAIKFSHSSGTAECYTTTKAQLNTVKDAIERFALKNDRFPMPARRNVGVESPEYGRESTTANLDKVNNPDGTVVVFGAVPFQVLGIPVENAADCWGNKISYMVTEALTDSTQFLIPATSGAIDVKTDTGGTNFLTGAGYVLISHGEDAMGAVKNNYATATNTPADRKWCTFAAGQIKTWDCDVTDNIALDAPFNNGKDAGNAYFDDLIVYRGKPWRTAAGECDCKGPGPINLFSASPTDMWTARPDCQ